MPSEMFPAFAAGYCLKIDIVPFMKMGWRFLSHDKGNPEHPYFYTALSLHELHHALCFWFAGMAFQFRLSAVQHK